MVRSPPDLSPSAVSHLPAEELVSEIARLTAHQAAFWSQAHGWADNRTADLLARAKLEWLVSLSRKLPWWLRPDIDPNDPGTLILAWTNLGSLVEGTLKLWLAVYRFDYERDPLAPRDRAGKLCDPESLTLEPLKQFLRKRDLISKDTAAFIEQVQTQRTAIHAFQPRALQSHAAFVLALRAYLLFLVEVDDSLPYP